MKQPFQNKNDPSCTTSNRHWYRDAAQPGRYNASTLGQWVAETILYRHYKARFHHNPKDYHSYGIVRGHKHAILLAAIAMPFSHNDLSCIKLCSSVFESGRKKGMK